MDMLLKFFLSNFHWSSVHKFLFGIKKKCLTTYLNVFLSKSYNIHFSDVFYDIIMFKINLHNIKLNKIGKNINNNSKFVLTFSNQVFNKININSIINDKSCLFPIKNLHISRTFKYTKTLGRKIFNHNSFCKNSFSLSTFSCYCNDPHLNDCIDNDTGHIFTGKLKIINNLQLNKMRKNGTKCRLSSHTNTETTYI